MKYTRYAKSWSNSSPIHKLGEGAYESRWWCQAKCEHRAGHAGIHGNPESGNHHQAPSHRETPWRYLPTCILTTASQDGGNGMGKLPHKCTITSSKMHDFQSEYASLNAERRPVCLAHYRERR